MGTKVAHNRKWNQEKIVDEIKKLYEAKENLTSNYCQKNRTALIVAANRHIGSWKKAIELAGIEYSSIRKTSGYKRWSKKSVVNNLKYLDAEGTEMSQSNIRKINQELILACERLFGSFKCACAESGIDYYKHYKGNKEYTDESVIAEILNLYKIGEALSLTDMKFNHGGLYTASLNRFGSWGNALKASGMDYELIRLDRFQASGCGFIFEKLAKEIMAELNYHETHQRTKEIQPDFTSTHKRWFDMKLSEWSIHQCETVEKYEPHCRMLTIIYFRGDKEREEMISNKTRIMSIYNLIKQLPKHKQKQYTERLENLNNKLKTQVS